MKKLFIILLSLSGINAFGYTLNADTTISGNWTPSGGFLYSVSAQVHGTGTIIGAVLLLQNPFIQYFDTTVSLSGCKAERFSAMWYGAATATVDNYNNLQKAITTCNNSMDLFIPRGTYTFTKPLKVFTLSGNTYIGSYINIYGEGDFWSGVTTLNYTGIDSFAIGFQVAKGGSIHNLKIKGKFVPPVNADASYYSIAQSAYNDISGGTTAGNYSGIVVDYDGSKNNSGSTGLKVYNTWVDGFDVCYLITGNSTTFNADNLTFDHIRCANARIGIESTQAQAKANVVRYLYSWDNIHTLISIGTEGRAQAGNWTIDEAGIAGFCVRFINISQHGYFSSHISNIYAEGLGTIGSILLGDSQNKPPISIDNSVFEFAYPAQAGTLTLLTSNSNYIKFNSCMFRYYGAPLDTLHFSGAATYDNCFFSGKVVNPSGSAYINYPIPSSSGGASSIRVSVRNEN